MKKIPFIFLASLGATLLLSCSRNKVIEQQKDAKPRMVLTCDPECDDNNSLIRYLLFSSDFQTEAIVYSSSEYHWTGDGKGGTQYLPDREYSGYGLEIGPQTRWRWNENERMIEDCLDLYEKAYPNLKIHDKDYPTPESLRAVFRYGNVEFEGEMEKDTPGSDLIKQIFLDDKPGPVFAMSWGGVNTIARALKSIEENFANSSEWNQIYKKICDKVILCMSGNQDDTYPTYIAVKWPDIKVQRGFGGGVSLGYHAQMSCPPQDTVYYSADWMKKYITSVGPFGPQVRVWGDGKQMVKDDIFDCFGLANKFTQQELLEKGYVEIHPFHPTGAFLGEGDTGNFLNQIDNGLRAWEDLTWGGWSGRNDPKAVLPKATGEYIHNPAPTRPTIYTAEMMTSMTKRFRLNAPKLFPDFIPAVQNGLAARFQWSATNNYENANHYPIVNGPQSMTGEAGKTLTVKAEVADPDKNHVNLTWRQFKVGTYEGDITLDNPHATETSFIIPSDAKSGQTIHLVLEATDDGQIPLTRYLRVVITVI